MSFTLSQSAGTSGTTIITVSADTRQELDSYVENFILSNETDSVLIPIVQKGEEPQYKYITISPSAITFPSSGGNQVVIVQSNVEWSWEMSEWMSASIHNGTSGKTMIPITASANTGNTKVGVIKAISSDGTVSALTTANQIGYSDTIVYITNNGQPYPNIQVNRVTGATFVESGYTNNTGWIRYSQTPTEIGDLFENNGSNPNMTITYLKYPEGVQKLGDYAAFALKALRNIDLPNSLIVLGSSVFSMSGLEGIDLKNVVSMGHSCFSTMFYMTGITIPNAVETIPNAFIHQSEELQYVIIGSGVHSIGSRFVALCNKLTDIYCYANTAPSIVSGTFEYAPSNVTVHHPKNSDYSSWESDQYTQNWTFIDDL